jgi:aspartyl-tRNA(Asn)/glutamyl-tRNA(Gln) amidotransferase subunit B
MVMGINVATTWEAVIGLEVHAQISTASKMYCACPAVATNDIAQANQYVCPVCLGHPGTLPRPNRQAVIRALTLARKLNCRIHERNVFARKNYFYPDLPKGYQISQYDLPLAEAGAVPYWHNSERRSARLTRIHLEEDTAKLFHMPDGTAVLDYNRGGVPLVEIVSQPDFHDPYQCVSYLDELRNLLKRLGVSEAAMESGNFRCEPNISVRPKGSTELRTKTEVKNLNSFATLRRAVDAEIARQIEIYERGGEVQQATLRYDEVRGITIPMRVKETADDYRYFDDPDIPPVIITPQIVAEAEEHVRASGFEVRQLMVEEDGLNHEQASIIAADHTLHHFYRLVCKDGLEPRQVANWVTGDLKRLLGEAPLKIEPGSLSAVLKRLEEGKLNGVQARTVFEAVYRTGKTLDAVIEEEGLGQGGAYDLERICTEAITANPKVVADIRSGKVSAVQVLVGHVLRVTKGGANPQEARDMLLRLLEVS